MEQSWQRELCITTVGEFLAEKTVEVAAEVPSSSKKPRCVATARTRIPENVRKQWKDYHNLKKWESKKLEGLSTKEKDDHLNKVLESLSYSSSDDEDNDVLDENVIEKLEAAPALVRFDASDEEVRDGQTCMKTCKGNFRHVLYPKGDPRSKQRCAILRCEKCAKDTISLFLNARLLETHMLEFHEIRS